MEREEHSARQMLLTDGGTAVGGANQRRCRRGGRRGWEWDGPAPEPVGRMNQGGTGGTRDRGGGRYLARLGLRRT